ncbi:hypothetical protein GR268_44460, partial [Rhizobium leguminosarum]|nr:hypothetical protein [Rhizobium leguminosarum]
LLGLAIHNQDYKVVKQLLKAGADINFRDNEGRTYLHLAVKNNQFAIFQALVDAGANVNAKDNYGNTPLHVVASNSHWHFVVLLLEAGSDLQATDNNGYTPLDHAMRGGRLQLVEVLSTANMHRFYASRCAARARKQLTLPQQTDSKKENIPAARIQKFLDDYTASLLPADKEKFNADIVP